MDWPANNDGAPAEFLALIKRFTKSEIFTSSLNFSQNLNTRNINVCQNMTYFQPFKNRPPPPCKWQGTGVTGGGREGEKLISYFLRGKMKVCCDIVRFADKIPIFKVQNVIKTAFWGLNVPPNSDAQLRFLLEISKQMPLLLVSSQGLTTHKVWRNWRFCLTIPILLKP